MENTESLDADVILPGAEFRRMRAEIEALREAVAGLLEAIDEDDGDEVSLNRLRYEELTGDRMHPRMRPTEMESYWLRFHSWVRARVTAARSLTEAPR